MEGSSSQIILEVCRLSFSYGDKVILRNINLELPAEKTIVLSGMNGAGKSSLLRCIMGLENYIGKIKYLDKKKLVSRKEFWQKTSWLSSEDVLYDRLSVLEHVDFFGKIAGTRDEMLYFVERFKLADHLTKKVFELSSGMKKRLNLSLLLGKNPSCFIGDEVYDHLDLSGRELLEEILLEKSKEMSMLLVLHGIQDIPVWSNAEYVLENGILKCLDS